MSKAQLFVRYHWRQTIVVFILAIAAIAWRVIDEDLLLTKKNAGQIMGETVTSEKAAIAEQNSRLIVAYQNGLKNTVGEYLTKRASTENNKEEWLRLIEEEKVNILGLIVPDEYKDLHVRVVTTMDLEKTAVAQNDMGIKTEANQRWASILKQYFWLNE